jgi:hypothetical protein
MATLIVVEELAGPAVCGRGGHAMRILQWLHGLERLGHRVLFLEFLEDDPGEGKAAAITYFREVISKWWRLESAALLDPSGDSLCGLSYNGIREIALTAAAVITLMPTYRRNPPPLVADIRPRILLEADPAYTHLWAIEERDPSAIFGEHDHYFTVGMNVGTPSCTVPTLGIRWRGLWNPVVLDWWLPVLPVVRDRFTTIADWRGYGYLEFEGRILGPKAEEFRQFIGLPRQTGETIELALDISAEDPDCAYLREHGWTLESPEVVRNAEQFRDYVSGSLGEFSCAKGGYVGTHCGWFSDRSACYLAAGRPVVLQATGFEDYLPTGKGLFAITNVDEAAEAIRAIRRDYATHSAAARQLAQEYFDSDKVLRRLLDEVGLADSAH